MISIFDDNVQSTLQVDHIQLVTPFSKNKNKKTKKQKNNNQKQSWLPAFWKKKDQKHTKGEPERFLIRQNKTKCFFFF